MNREVQERAFDSITARMKEILMRKGDDYSNGEDRLSCFKKGGSLAGVTAESQCLSLLTNKVVRLSELLNSDTEPQNETINDTLDDLGNFVILCQMIRMDSAAGRARANDKCGEHWWKKVEHVDHGSNVIQGDFAAKKPAICTDPRYTAEPVKPRSSHQVKVDKVVAAAYAVLKDFENKPDPAA
jgi:hypothetical protein